MAEVIRSENAADDLVRIWQYVANDHPVAADRLLNQINSACGFLAANPNSGKAREDLAVQLRFYPVGKYLVFYRPRADGIFVVRVIHGARDYGPEMF